MKAYISWGLSIVASLLIGFVVLEGIARNQDGQDVFVWRNWIGYEYVRTDQQAFAIYDPVLGWSMRENILSSNMNTYEHGMRRNYPEDSFEVGGILAVGDSFAAGSEVSDHESWPAHLEEITGINVSNAGVGGYGLDQAILRAEQLMGIIQPDIILLGLLDQDILRMEYNVYGNAKPYFELIEGRIRLQNVPVPLPSQTQTEGRSGWMLALGYSYVFDRILASYWPHLRMPSTYETVEMDRDEMACAGLRHFRDVAWSEDIPVVLVMQYGSPPFLAGTVRSQFGQALLDCADDLEVPYVDEYHRFAEYIDGDETRYPDLWVLQTDGVSLGHTTSLGNKMVAELIAEAVRTLPPIPEAPQIPVEPRDALYGGAL